MKGFAKLRRRLSDELNVVQDPGLNQFFLFKRLSAPSGVTLDIRDGIQNVLQSLLRVPHSGMPSRRTRSRIRGLMPRLLTTSTLTPSSS